MVGCDGVKLDWQKRKEFRTQKRGSWNGPSLDDDRERVRKALTCWVTPVGEALCLSGLLFSFLKNPKELKKFILKILD